MTLHSEHHCPHVFRVECGPVGLWVSSYEAVSRMDPCIQLSMLFIVVDMRESVCVFVARVAASCICSGLFLVPVKVMGCVCVLVVHAVPSAHFMQQ